MSVSIEKYVNNPQGTLASNMDNSQTTLSLTSATGYPSLGTGEVFHIKVDSEIMLVTARSGTTLTVTRGAESSAAASHTAAATVHIIWSAGALDNVRGNMNTVGLYSALPSSMKAGDRYQATDSGYDVTYDGSSKRYFFQGREVFPPGLAGSYSWSNQGSFTLIDDGGYFLSGPGTGGVQVRMYGVTAPSFPFKCTVAMLPYASNNEGYGIGVVATDGTKYEVFLLIRDTSNKQIAAYQCSSATNISTTWREQFQDPSQISGLVFLRTTFTDATHRTYEVSNDGVNWISFSSASSGSFTPNLVGPGIIPYGSTINGVTQPYDRIVSVQLS